jgi:predicted Rossmann-fold nucleotide-binding protein
MGVDFWAPLVQFLRAHLVAERTIDAADVERLVMTDSPTEAVARIKDIAMTQFALSYGPRPRRRWYLGGIVGADGRGQGTGMITAR